MRVGRNDKLTWESIDLCTKVFGAQVLEEFRVGDLEASVKKLDVC